MKSHDYQRKTSRDVPGLGRLCSLFGLGICAIVGALIALVGLHWFPLNALKTLQPLIDRGEPVQGRVLRRSADKIVTYVVEYRLDFEDEARRERIRGAPGFEVAAGVADGTAERVPLLYDPLNPGEVVFADALGPQVDAAVAHLRPWKPVAWITLIVGVLLSAFTFLPMKRLAREHGVLLMQLYHNDPDYSWPARPVEVGKAVGMAGTVGGLVTLVVFTLLFLSEGRVLDLARHGVPIRGEVVESFNEPRAERNSFRFKIRYTPEEGGATIERDTKILGGIRARRFEVEEGETREVDLIYDPRKPRSARLALPLEWELARSRTTRTVAAVVMAFALALTCASILLHTRCRRILIEDPEETGRRRRTS